MKKSMIVHILFGLLLGCVTLCLAGEIPVKYEELTVPQFIEAVEKSGKIVILPLGILEKHGPHLPLGTDMIDVREICFRATKQEYAVVFPQFYFGQIFEARHQPGTIAYSPDLVWEVLQETCDELGRNGFTKIILVNGHGGNNNLLPYFCQAQLAEEKDYAVVWFRSWEDPKITEKIQKLRKTVGGGHADEEETSMMFSHRPDLVHTDVANDQSGEDLNRLDGIPNFYTGICWYASYPNHYAGDGSEASKEMGDLILDSDADQLAELIRKLKKDDRILELQQQFYKEAADPLQTKQ
ncbi:creatininase family protein [candidate division KSB1 bacterium]|nr:creatininase family protein [candidate division KSB1 bacterium]